MKKRFYLGALIVTTTFLTASCYVTGVPSYDTLNVRVSPSLNSKKVGELAPNAGGIEILYCKRKAYSSPWCKIRYSTSNAKIVGWVNSRFLYCPSINYYCVDKVSRYDTLAVRSRPSYKAKKVGELAPYAEGVKKIRCKGHWCKVSYTINGAKIIGWVNSKYLVPCGD